MNAVLSRARVTGLNLSVRYWVLVPEWFRKPCSFFVNHTKILKNRYVHGVLGLLLVIAGGHTLPVYGSEQVRVAFEKPQYHITPGEIFPVSVVIDLSPEQNIESFGIQLLFDPAKASAAGVGTMEVNPSLAFDGPRADLPVIAVGSGFAAAKGTIRFQAGETPLPTNRVLVTFLIRDLNQGSYKLSLDFFNTLGSTEQIFVDNRGQVLDSLIQFGTADVIPMNGLQIQADGPISLNRQTGLFEETIRLVNAGQFPVFGATIAINNLPLAWSVANASGTNSGVPYLRVTSNIPGGQSLLVKAEFRVPDRNPQGRPTYSIMDHNPGVEPPLVGKAFLVSPRANLPDGSFLIEFSTLLNRYYAVQYSKDLTNWVTSFPHHRGNGSRSQWIDYGPPKTEKLPSEEATRFYRVFLVP